jgi:hypothetical protein
VGILSVIAILRHPTLRGLWALFSLTASLREYRLAKLLVEDYVVQRLTVAILVLNVFIPTVFAQTVEQKEPGASPGCVEIIKGTERHCEKFTPLPSAQTAQQAARQASEPAPPPTQRPQVDAPIVRIEYGSSGGMCFGYSYSQTIIQARMMRSVLRTRESLNGNGDIEYPDKESKRKITTEQWKRAKAAVDTENFDPVPDRCPGCFDRPVDWITVQYSDGTTMSVTCNRGCPATDMVDKIRAALAQASGKDPLNRSTDLYLGARGWINECYCDFSTTAER